MTTNPDKRNQGEGDKASARRYNRAARRFREGGRVDDAAEHAREMLDAAPVMHAAAEVTARRRSHGEDPELYRPAWWTDKNQGAWDRVARALRRDWQQTLYDVTLGSRGENLDQDVGDTIGQMSGSEPIPPEGEPTGVLTGVPWSGIEYAIRFGFSAADGQLDRPWSDDVARELEREWNELPDAPAWDRAAPHVRTGYKHRRARL